MKPTEMKRQLSVLNCLRSDFKKWADSNEPNSWELDLNEIGRNLTGFSPDDEPVILLSDDKWFLCVNILDVNENGCYPIESLTDKQISEIRIIVESWLARKDLDNFFI